MDLGDTNVVDVLLLFVLSEVLVELSFEEEVGVPLDARLELDGHLLLRLFVFAHVNLAKGAGAQLLAEPIVADHVRYVDLDLVGASCLTHWICLKFK